MKNWRRKLIGGICLSSAAFVFQACYGVPADFGDDFLIEGLVKSKKTGLPINGVKVSTADHIQYTVTDEEGKFGFYVPKKRSILLQFEDIDSIRTIFYAERDSLLTPIGKRQENIHVIMELDEKDETKQTD